VRAFFGKPNFSVVLFILSILIGMADVSLTDIKVSIRLWNVVTDENIDTFWGDPPDVPALAFSPDGTLLASGSYNGTLLLWDLKPYIPHEPSRCDWHRGCISSQK